MRVAIIGANGMLGSDLYKILCDTAGIEVFPFYGPKDGEDSDYKEETKIDITKQSDTEKKLARINPEVIIHTAAYTDVDGCELNSERAYQINALGTENIALAAKKTGATLIYISTDYVFNGEKEEPYREEDLPNPMSLYGKTKLEGEKFVQNISGDKWIIIRTSWLFGKNGKNFVKSILGQTKKQKVLKVVNDQIGSPTYTVDLAGCITFLLKNCRLEKGIYHLTNQGFCSWFDFTVKIIQFSGLDNAITVEPIKSSELVRPARRPHFSILGNYAWKKKNYPLARFWEAALKEYLKETGELKVNN